VNPVAMEGEEEELLELDLDEEEAELASKFLAIAVFYSQKSYSLQYLFSDMQNAWGITKLKAIEKLGEYSFKVEFEVEEEKRRVLEGGPWCHKGDALIVVHCNGLYRPSEVRITTIQVLV
jgi:hypothetical protein